MVVLYGKPLGRIGRQFGYQLTFFRFGVRGEIESGGNPWQVRDLYMAHFTVTEVEENNFSVAERISRAGPGLAGARTDRMEVWIFNWSAVMRDSVILLEARDGALELNLTLTPVKPLVFHGENGLSKKGQVPVRPPTILPLPALRPGVLSGWEKTV